MRKRRTLKYYIRQLHLWLGLASGLVVFIVSITGCLFVFQQEISRAFHPEWYVVPARTIPPASAPLSLSRLRQSAQAAFGPDHPINYMITYAGQDRSWEFSSYQGNDSAFTSLGSIVYYQSVYVDPYTGAVVGKRDNKHDFFMIVKSIHWSLLLNTPYGQPIVGWSTLIFVIGLITGLVLWWPKKWTGITRARSFKIKWKASFRRVNYDLHNVPGFYSLLPALIIGLTGLVFAFRWFTAFIYLVTTGSASPAPEPDTKSKVADSTFIRQTTVADALDKAFVLSQQELPGCRRIAVAPAQGKEGVISARGYKDAETFYGYDVLLFDQYSGRLLSHSKDSQKTAGQRLLDMNYDIHVGAIGGLTGKIIAFIASLICASLPVTGFLVWWLKRKKTV